jgi:hypothetical protein
VTAADLDGVPLVAPFLPNLFLCLANSCALLSALLLRPGATSATARTMQLCRAPRNCAVNIVVVTDERQLMILRVMLCCFCRWRFYAELVLCCWHPCLQRQLLRPRPSLQLAAKAMRGCQLRSSKASAAGIPELSRLSQR